MNSHELIHRRGPGPATAVMLPGWATDGRFFELMDTRCSVVTPGAFVPSRYLSPLADYLRDAGCTALTVMGWSLGGFAAVEFARAYPDLVGRLILVGVRRRYPAQQIAAFRRRLLADRRRCLIRFYRECFLPPQTDDYRRFRDRLMQRYLEEMSTEELMEGLDCLESCRIDPRSGEFPAVGVTFVHGAQDPVAPEAESRSLAAEIPCAKLIVLPGAGHAACLACDLDSMVDDV